MAKSIQQSVLALVIDAVMSALADELDPPCVNQVKSPAREFSAEGLVEFRREIHNLRAQTKMGAMTLEGEGENASNQYETTPSFMAELTLGSI
jgi:hypothetical protein